MLKEEKVSKDNNISNKKGYNYKYAKAYYEKKKNEKIICAECGGTYNTCTKYNHLKSKKHQQVGLFVNNMKNNLFTELDNIKNKL